MLCVRTHAHAPQLFPGKVGVYGTGEAVSLPRPTVGLSRSDRSLFSQSRSLPHHVPSENLLAKYVRDLTWVP